MTTMVEQENYTKLWEETFGSRVNRCTRCQSVIDSRFNVCTLCFSEVKYQTLTNEVKEEKIVDGFVPLTPVVIDFRTRPSGTLIFIKMAACIEKGLDKFGDGIIFVMGKAYTLLMFVLNKNAGKPRQYRRLNTASYMN